MGTLVTCYVTLLSGCVSTPTPELQFVNVNVPKALRKCAKRPEFPVQPIDQKAVSSLLVKLDSAHGDCRRKLAAVNRILLAAEARGPSK